MSVYASRFNQAVLNPNTNTLLRSTALSIVATGTGAPSPGPGTPVVTYTDRTKGTIASSSGAVATDGNGELAFFADPPGSGGIDIYQGSTLLLSDVRANQDAGNIQAPLAGGSGTAWFSGTNYAPGSVVGDGGYTWCDSVGGVSTTAPHSDNSGRWVRLGALVGSMGLLAQSTLATGFSVTQTSLTTFSQISVSPTLDGGPILIVMKYALVNSTTAGDFQGQIYDNTAAIPVDNSTYTLAASAKGGLVLMCTDYQPAAGARTFMARCKVGAGMTTTVAGIDSGNVKSSLSVYKVG